MSTTPNYKVRANSNRVVKVDIYPVPGKGQDIVVRTHRSRKFSDSEYHLFARRPSFLTLVAIILALIIVELQIIIHMRDKSGVPRGLRHIEHTETTVECNFHWDSMQCTPGCCLRTYRRKTYCEVCNSHPGSGIVSISYRSDTTTTSSSEAATSEIGFPAHGISFPGWSSSPITSTRSSSAATEGSGDDEVHKLEVKIKKQQHSNGDGMPPLELESRGVFLAGTEMENENPLTMNDVTITSDEDPMKMLLEKDVETVAFLDSTKDNNDNAVTEEEENTQIDHLVHE